MNIQTKEANSSGTLWFLNACTAERVMQSPNMPPKRESWTLADFLLSVYKSSTCKPSLRFQNCDIFTKPGSGRVTRSSLIHSASDLTRKQKNLWCWICMQKLIDAQRNYVVINSIKAYNWILFLKYPEMCAYFSSSKFNILVSRKWLPRARWNLLNRCKLFYPCFLRPLFSLISCSMWL